MGDHRAQREPGHPPIQPRHTWDIPSSIPPGGAPATLNVSATDKSGTRISAKTSLFGYVNVDGGGAGAEVIANADQVGGPATHTATPKTVTLTPRGGADANGMVLLTVRISDGPDIKFNYRVVTTPAPTPTPVPTPTPAATPTVLPVTPRSVLPRVGVITSYAAPRPGGTRVYGLPVLGASIRAATGDIVLVRQNGPGIDDPGFIVAVEPSDQNLRHAHHLCAVLVLQGTEDPGPTINSDGLGSYQRCISVVARILQRAEELRRRPDPPLPLSARAAQAGRCRSATVRRRGSRARSPVVVTCVRTTPVGMRITIRSRSRNRSLRSAIGRAPRLIIGRSRLTDAQRGDRLNVFWRTSTRR